MLGVDVLVIELFGFLGAISEYAFALVTQRHIHRRRYLFADRGVSLDLRPNGIHSSLRPEESIRQRFIFPQNTQQQMFGFDVRTAKLAGLVPSEKNCLTRLLGIAFKHRLCRFRYWLTILSPTLAGPSPWKAPTDDASLTVRITTEPSGLPSRRTSSLSPTLIPVFAPASRGTIPAFTSVTMPTTLTREFCWICWPSEEAT